MHAPGCLVFDFMRDLPPGVKCSFTLKPETKPLAGGVFSGKTVFAFSGSMPVPIRRWSAPARIFSS